MIVVSGTGRSGTSMWMQVLGAAGFPVLGEAFPGEWERLIGLANPKGFFESTLVSGINFTTNPDPDSGAVVEAEPSRDVVVKVFLRGLMRTEFRYLNHVVVSTRQWRVFCASVRRLEAMQQHMRPGEAALPTPDSLLSEPAIHWWLDHYNMIQDQERRGFAFSWVSYESVLADPERVVSNILNWIGLPHDIQAAVDAIDSSLDTQSGSTYSCSLKPRWVRALDELYCRVNQGLEIDGVFRREMDEVNRQILGEIRPQSAWESPA